MSEELQICADTEGLASWDQVHASPTLSKARCNSKLTFPSYWEPLNVTAYILFRVWDRGLSRLFVDVSVHDRFSGKRRSAEVGGLLFAVHHSLVARPFFKQ